MGSHITPSFCVEDPEMRLERARAAFTVDDFLGLMDNKAPDGYGVLSLRTMRRVPSKDGLKGGGIHDVTVWGPYVDAVLEPGEYACVLAASNTTDSGAGAIYYKRKSDGAVEIIDTVTDDRHQAGEDAARECLHKYGFEPTVFPGRVRGWATLNHDPAVLFAGMRTLELAITDPETDLTLEEGCPTCAGRDRQGRVPPSDFYIEQRICDVCDTSCAEVDWSKLFDPADACKCGGEFTRYERQYADLGSTAFECDQCGIITFDIGQLDVSELNPHVSYQERDTVHPDYTGYYDGHGKRSVWPPEAA